MSEREPLKERKIGLFSCAEAERIRREYAEGKVSQQELARRYGVPRQTMARLLRGVTYREP